MSGGESDEEVIRRSSRRRESKRVETRKSALELLKEARRSGKSHKPEDNTVQNVYEEVDEDEYNEIVKQRQHDDFVVDDDGNGYVDHGADIFDDDEDMDDGDGGRRGKKKKNKDKDPKEKKGGISSFFSKATVTKAKVKDDNDVKLEDDDMLNDLLAEAGNDDVVETPINRNPFKRQAAPPSPDHIAPKAIKRNRLSVPLSTSTPPVRQSETRTLEVEQPARRPNARAVQEPVHDDFDDDFGIDVDDVVGEMKVEVEEEKVMKKEEIKMESEPLMNHAHHSSIDKLPPVPITVAPTMEFDQWDDDEMADEKEETLEIPDRIGYASLAYVGFLKHALTGAPVVETKPGSETFYRESESGKSSIRMFWMDAYEDDKKHPGTVYLFGRVVVSDKRTASCCVVVKNVRRQIFVLPRQQDDGTLYPMVDVYNEIKGVLMEQHGVTEVKCKPVKRRFINDGTVADSTESVDVMEVQYYESRSTRLPATTEGRTFSRVYNTTTTSMERLLVECGLKGPGWIDVTGYASVSSKVSYCKYEFSLDMMDDLKGGTEGRPKSIVYDKSMESSPSIRMMCLNVVTALNDKKEPEILALSYMLNTNASLSDPTTDRKAFKKKAYICQPPQGSALPFDLQKKLADKGLKDYVQIFPKEKSMLLSFVNNLSREDIDPDCFVGHDVAATVTLLMERCEKHKIPVWSQLSRLRRSASIKKLGHGKAAQWEVTAGRVLLDSRSAAMELVHSRNYDLSELVSSLLGQKRLEVHPHEVVAKYCGSSPQLIGLLLWSWNECLLPLSVLAQMQALPLFTMITNICGGVLSRTLMGGRAERNEFLLLHAFAHSGLIAPDKYQHVFTKKPLNGVKGKSSSSQSDDVIDEDGEKKEGGQGATIQVKGAQYSGGLVLEPKKGLYDTLILLLDFNSLYPSIIQEYNICFTTIRHEKNGDDLPEPPGADQPKGILPSQIEQLVTQRYEVKKIMANERNLEKKKQYDIRQKALKLTANSMYGCLGFAQSRFYAKPLAALVTAKGREILMETKDLVERAGHEVIYGDTDSIMVNTGDVDEERAKRVAKEIKSSVNRLRAKLELEHEGTFRRMLLLKKKKYAALIMESNGSTKKELKGLDIVRRDWSMLAKNTGSDIVDLILNPSLSREELVEQIDNRLVKLKTDLDEGRIDQDQFSIFKSLTRDPSKYEDVRQQSHAAVAQRMNKSGQKTYKQGDIVEYVICLDGTSNSAVQRAYHKQEIKERAEELKIDIHYYLAHQVHPVVSRLCAPIEELDTVRIAESLGLDGSQFRRSGPSAHNDAGSAVWQESFDHCEGIRIDCVACGHSNEIRDIFRGEGMDRQPSLESCSNCGVRYHDHYVAVFNQFRRQLSALVEREHQAAYTCDDVVCAFKMSAFPMRITRDGTECPKCRTGFMQKEYTAKNLFEQQTFFARLLDINAAVKSIKNHEQRTTIEHRPHFRKVETLSLNLKDLNEQYMKRNSYNIIDLCFLFGPMMAK